jgi:hypothetical protein
MALTQVPMTAAARAAAADETGLRSEIIKNIRGYANSRPRSLQTTIGPSQVGTPCARQLAFQIGGREPGRDIHDPWPSIVGTATHAWLADAMEWANAQALLEGKPQPWHIEKKVDVGLGLRGSCDAFHEPKKTVIDWKVLGDTQHREYATGDMSTVYRVQAHCYGFGYYRAGYDVERVAIGLFGRAKKLSDLHIWSEPFDPEVALRALKRLKIIQQAIAAGRDPMAIPATPGGACYFCSYKGKAEDGYCPGKAA